MKGGVGTCALWCVLCVLLWTTGSLGVLRAPKVPPPPPPPRLFVPPGPQHPSPAELRGRVVTIVMKDYYMARLVDNTSEWQRFKYHDGYVLDAFQKVTQILPRVVPPSGCSFLNSTCSPLEDILQGKADMTFIGEYLWTTRLPVDFSPVLRSGYLTVVTARGDVEETLEMIAKSIEVVVWVTIFVTMLVAAFIWRMTVSTTKPSILKAIMKVMPLMASVPTNQPQKISSHSTRLLISTCALFSIVFVCFIQGDLVDNMTTHFYLREIQTMKELDESDFQIVAIQDRYARGFSGSDSKTLNNLYKKVVMRREFFPDFIKLLDWVSESPGIATVLPRTIFKVHVPLTGGGKESLHEISEHPFMYYFAYALPHGSMFSSRLKDVVGWLHQSGLLLHWWKEAFRAMLYDSLRERSLAEREEESKHVGHDSKIIDIRDFLSVFVLVIVSYVTAGIVLLVEVALKFWWLPKVPRNQLQTSEIKLAYGINGRIAWRGNSVGSCEALSNRPR